MIYKYTTYKWLPDIISTNSLHFSCPLDFNDPFDSFIKVKGVDEKYTKDEIDEIVKICQDEKKEKTATSNIKFKQKKIEEILKENKEKADKIFLVLSLSELKDNILMWSHYADSHKGFCIGFKSDIDELNLNDIEEKDKTLKPCDNDINKQNNNNDFLLFEGECFDFEKIKNSSNKSDNILQLSELASKGFNKKLFFSYLGKIDYQHEKDNIMPEAFDYFRCNFTNDNNRQNELKKIEKFLTTKNNLWQYEKEKRIIIADSHISKEKCPNNNIKFEKSLLKEIIFGVRTPEVHKLCIRALVEKMCYENVEFYQAERKDDKYEITIKKI